MATDLLKSAPFLPALRGGEDGEPLTLFSRFATWSNSTEIDSLFEGNFMERLAPGSMPKTMHEDRANIRLLFQHGRDPSSVTSR